MLKLILTYCKPLKKPASNEQLALMHLVYICIAFTMNKHCKHVKVIALTTE